MSAATRRGGILDDKPLGISLDAAVPAGQMTWGLHFSPTPNWFDPGETSGATTPYILLYALHDAMIRPSPGDRLTPGLAESWTVSPDGLVYEFVLRKGVEFHNGDPLTAEDVKFSFDRYRGAAQKTLKENHCPTSRDRDQASELADAKGVPILAAAIGTGARLLVTQNIRHFRSDEGERSSGSPRLDELARDVRCLPTLRVCRGA